MTKIEHKDGTTPLDSFTYALDTGGLITRVTQVDGSYWDYTYDNRYRLTGATRNNAGVTLTASYAYTYDLGDNLLTKVEPFREDFNDGNTTGWTASSGTWSATGYYAANSNGSDATLSRSNTDGSNELWLRYYRQSGSTSAEGMVYPRYTDADNWVRVVLSPSGMALEQKDGGTLTALDTDSATTADDTWYNLHIVSDGANVNVYRRSGSSMESLVLSTTAATETGTASLVLGVTGTGTLRYDDLQCLSADLSNTTTFGVNNANELTAMSDPNGTTSFGFDAWGRMTSKTLGSVSATYAYRYGQMLTSVSTTFPDEGNVTYDYDGNAQRRERTVGSTTTYYNWDTGFDLISEEDGSGTLTRSYTGRLADVTGSSPSTGTARHYHGDYLSSSRRVTDGTGDTLAAKEFVPFSSSLSQSGVNGPWSFAMLAEDDSSGLLFAPFRYYLSGASRWLTRDALGMEASLNLYGYVYGNPACLTDSMGLCIDFTRFLDGLQATLSAGGVAIPGAGNVLDLINAGISAGRGDLVGAAMDLAAAVPGAGAGAGAANAARRASKWLQEAPGIFTALRKTSGDNWILRKGNRQLHFHNTDLHPGTRPHIDLQRMPGGKNKGRLPC